MKAHLALYGNIAIPRGKCPNCGGMALIIQGKWACCDKDASDAAIAGLKRIVEPEQTRGLPSRDRQKAILEAQDYRCLYCERRFGDVAPRGKQRGITTLRIVWDHMVPYSYNQNNGPDNFAAACQQCNAVKLDKMFQTIEEARVYVQTKIASKGLLVR
jgi:hypothetical protein